jgi:pimeloyl-ACP methyl ester carboxylesterase
MAVGEALTNLLAAPVTLRGVKLSCNWMAAAGTAGEDAALYDTVHAVAMELCLVLNATGATTLRFNFRGAGRSEGSFDGGRGERGDAMAAAAFLRQRQPAAHLIVAGSSFGAMIAAAAPRN